MNGTRRQVRRLVAPAPPGPIGYYVHHHGAGHGAHARALADVVGDRLVGLGSGSAPAGWNRPWVQLARDDSPAPSGDPTRGGAWHWAPAGHDGFRARTRSLAQWIADHEPSVVVADVSAEVVVLAALLGVPTAMVLLHGRRTDRAHRLALDTADVVVAPWPAEHAEPWQDPWEGKTRHLGLMSCYDLLPPPDLTATPPQRVLVVGGSDGLCRPDIERAAAATPEWSWDVVGDIAPPGGHVASPVRCHGRVEDLWPLLASASVVVSAAGAATVADIAAARRPAVLIPRPRPFDEQQALAGHLAGAAPVVVCEDWPAPDRWPALLRDAVRLDGRRWAARHDRSAASRFAAALAEVARPGVGP